MARKNCCCGWKIVTPLNVCYCETASGGPFALARKSVARWAAFFCASGLDGVVRNLTAGEIVEQMLRLQRLLPKSNDDTGERLSHIVVMGMGEPLANLDRLLPALAEAISDTGLGISHRRITISTVGLPPAVDRLSELDARFQLAVSLHAPNDELRNRLVPANKNIGLAAIVAAADRYFEVSGRRLTFEYVLLGD